MRAKKKSARTAAAAARRCLDCPGANSLMCCKRKPIAVNDNGDIAETLFDNGRPML